MTGDSGVPRDDGVMTPERWSLVEELFARAAELGPNERAEFLDTAAGSDLALRRVVERLLAEHERDPAFLESPPPWLAAGSDASDELPDRIGEYRILRRLGGGGMGQVFLAEREAPGFRQQVALKVMRRGLDTDDLIRRFRNERQILASLDHANIARLLDVGATEDGLPYFVMEHVEGATILDHCNRLQLTVRQRLGLFRTICSAVQHAHQSLVVHRDLKPGNILVTKQGVPKLLDFGIAKILDPERSGLEHATTRADERLLTPEYAAPEQLRGGVVTTACDVHALGVLLYELLSGRHPYASGERRTRSDLARRILEVDPAPPSVAIAPSDAPAAAAARSTTTDALRRALAGDLDTIVLKALRKEPDARYASALSFSDDLRRHLDGLPVEARPATVRYRLRKFARRNRVAVAAGAALFLLLSGFSGVTAYQSGRVREESARVVRERDKAFEVGNFLLETFGATGANQATGDPLTVRELLDRRAETLAEAYATNPDLHAEMLGVLAQAYEKLGLYAVAEPLASQALEEKLTLHGERHADVAFALNTLGWIQRQLGDLEQAEATLARAVGVGRFAFPRDGDARLARALNDLGVVRAALGRYDEAAEVYTESIEMRSRLVGEGHVGVAVTLNNLANVLFRNGNLEGAVGMAERSVASFMSSMGPDHERTNIALGNLAGYRATQGNREEAAAVYEQILARHRRVLGDRHPHVAYALTLHATQLVALGRHEEAEPLLQEALEIQRETLGPRHDRVALTLRVIGDAAHAAGRGDEALAHYEAALATVHEVLGNGHPDAAELELRMARVHDAAGRTPAAERGYREGVRLFTAAHGAEHHLTAGATLDLAEFLLGTGRAAEASALLEGVTPVIERLASSFASLAQRLERTRDRRSSQ